MEKEISFKQKYHNKTNKFMDNLSTPGTFAGLIVSSYMLPLLLYFIIDSLIGIIIINSLMFLMSVFAYYIYLHISKHNDVFHGDIIKCSFFLSVFYMFNMFLLSMLNISLWVLIPIAIAFVFELDVLGKCVNMDNVKNII